MKLIVASAALCLVVAANLKARVIVVPDNAPTIQAGLDSLSSGDTVIVRNGTTYQEVLVAPAIVFALIGQADAGFDSPMIDASDLQIDDATAVLEIPFGANASIENLHIRNRNRYAIKSWAERVTIRNCVVESVRYGFREFNDDIGSVVTLEYCRFTEITWWCVLTRPGSSLHAKHCDFDGAGDSGVALVIASSVTLDSCTFASVPNRQLLGAWEGPHVVTNCTFGPVLIDEPVYAVEINDGRIRIAGNQFRSCQYYTHTLRVTSNLGDSVEVTGNRFERCRPAQGVPSAFGVMAIETPTPGLERGALIADNVFVECSGNSAVDDIAASVYFPALLTGNVFVRDSANGLPSVFAGNYLWQQTPLILRENAWHNCGYAVSLGATADAQFNYWGDASGPFHAVENPDGLGDTIAGPVPFIPWLEDTVSGVSDHRPEIVDGLQLLAYPNPFNSTVTIEYALTRDQDITLEIFDVLGRKVETLLSERQGIGVHSVKWNAEGSASGLYFARLSTVDPVRSSQAVKLLLLK